MLKHLKIGTKITIMLLTSVFFAVVVVSVASYKISSDSIRNRYAETLQVIVELKSEEIRAIFADLATSTHSIRNQRKIKTGIRDIHAVFQTLKKDTAQVLSSDSLLLETKQHLDAYMEPILNLNKYKSIMLLDTAGLVLYNTNKTSQHLIGKQFKRFTETKNQNSISSNTISYSTPYMINQEAYIDAFAPIYQNDLLLGYVVTEFNMNKIYKVTNDTIGLSQTGELLIAQETKRGVEWLILNEKRNQTEPLKFTKLEFKEGSQALQDAVQGGNGAGLTIDYQGQMVLAEWRYIPEMRWGIIVKIDKDEITQHADYLAQTFIYVSIIIIFLVWFVAAQFAAKLISPLLSLRQTLQIVAKGILPNNIPKTTYDEIGEMANAVENLVQSLKRHANFAERIGAKEYNTEFTAVSKEDTLGNALIAMRDNIQIAEEKDNERNWIVKGLAEIGQTMRLHNDLESLGDNLLSYIAEEIRAVQGAFYTVTKEENAEPILEMNASYAYGKKKYIKAQFRFAEGLVGQCAIEKDTVLRTEIPKDYLTITSGILGDKKPKCLLFVPLITNEETFGVLEFAGFERFTQVQVKFVEEISLTIARTIFNIKVNARTAMLLEESNLQKEALRQRGEEMKATQLELQETNAKLEEQFIEVQRAQKRMQIILENASEVITIYEEDGSIRYVSPSVESIWGYRPSELVGKRDILNVTKESQHVIEEMFEKLLADKTKSITIEYEYKLKNKTTIWLEATGRNLLADPAIHGIVLNSRDITERRRAEQEARMRGQMQSLSENSPDLITRFDSEGNVFYINPTIKHLTGAEPDAVIHQNLEVLDISQETKEFWKNLLKEVTQKQTMIRKEMPFKSRLGERIMNVNGIPEFDNTQQMESVLIVANDITAQKQTESALLNTNKKIRESINYAKRIQTAILPDMRTIRKVFTNSFIFYQPRDVVSGDFPWFIETENYTFVAVVDCTGHGVPGALISLIGYFLLNDIVNTQEIDNSGLILDMLSRGVEKTLRQDIEATTRDGMDIALCRININQTTLQYAGAHRPLYRVRKGNLTQIKGDKFPVGGGQYKNRKEFQTHDLQIQSNDAVYCFSDGLPDQFGGPNNRKFSPKQVRHLVIEHEAKPMAEIGEIFRNAFQTWKGNRKQTDDVLLIGIKF